MRVLITTGLFSFQVGGPAQYAPNLTREFRLLNHKAITVHYGLIEKVLPPGVRHLFFFFKILPYVLWADRIIALDTFSVGAPTLLATKILRKEAIVRIGGDFLWESYVNRTGEKITLPEFYKMNNPLNLKEQIILYYTNFLIKNSKMLVFNTIWQQRIWLLFYNIPQEKTCIIRNYVPKKSLGSEMATNKIFLWAGRESKVKNIDMLVSAVNEIKSKYPEFKLRVVKNLLHSDLLKEIKNCYAIILPSLSDVCPNLILEAISFNKPFIMTKETGINEIYNKGGIFINPTKKLELICAIEEILKPEKYAILVQELLLFNVEHSWGQLAKEFIAI